MNLGKKFFAIVATCAIVVTSPILCMEASAKTVSKLEHRPYDFLTFNGVYDGDFSKFYANVNSGIVASKNPNYDRSYKTVAYRTYRYNGSLIAIEASDSGTGTTPSVGCSVSPTPGASTVSREYSASVYMTSSPGSNIVDSYSIRINKN